MTRTKKKTQPKKTRAKKTQPKAKPTAGRRTDGTAQLPKLLKLAEAADAVGVSQPTIVRAYRAGQIRVFRTPLGGSVRIYADSLAAWIAKNSVGGGR
ncbi:MAG: helix-turn-helix domain-containing protein [Candidatus Tyrphobacter sp.]